MKHKLLTLASAAAMFAACSDTAVSDANDEIKEKATVTFFVYDVLTRMPLEDVSVYYRTTDKTKLTDSTGSIVWQDVDLGDSYFDFQLDGYAMKRHDVKITDDMKHDVARVRDNTEKVEMYELGVDVKGKFYYVDPETNNWIPAPEGTVVYVDYPDGSEIYPNEVYTKVTGDDGDYEFKNLAANIGFTVKSLRFNVDSTVYEVDSIGATAQRKGVLKEMDPIAAKVASLEPKLLSTNLGSLGVKDEIKLTFSEVLEKDSVTTNYIFVNRVLSDSKDPLTGKPDDLKAVAVSLSLSDDGKTVSIKSNSGEWADGKDYIIDFKVWSKLAKALQDSVKIDGVDYKFYRKFTAGALEVPGAIKNLMVKLDDDDEEMIDFSYEGEYTIEATEKGKAKLGYNETITIKWDALETNVSQYNVYVKGDNDADADYIYAGKTIAGVGEDTVFTINLADVLNKGNFLSFPKNKKQSTTIDVIVLAKNSTGEALASKAKALTIKVYDKAAADVKAKQTNDYVEEASVEIVNLYGCTAKDDPSCTELIKTVDKFDDATYSHFKANLSIKGTVQSDYDGDYPNGYALYFKSSDGWTKIKEGAVPMFTVEYTEKVSPFNAAAVEYDASEARRYTYAIVPFFEKKTLTGGTCSDGISLTAADCIAAGETWTPSYSVDFAISQTDIGAKAGVYTANDDLVAQIKKWDK